MATPRENFGSWFVNVLESLYPHREAGFVILMTAFPLLERYLRQRAGIPAENEKLDYNFYYELHKFFPRLGNTDQAKDFWQICRNGLLHQATFSEQRAIYGKYGFASHDLTEAIHIDENGNFGIHPVYFSKQILSRIGIDFSTFEGRSSNAPPLSAEGSYSIGSSQMIIGTALPTTGLFKVSC